MALFLQSIQPIVPDPGSLKCKSTSSSSPSENQSHKGIPSAFVEEIESLRTRVDELSDEVSSESPSIRGLFEVKDPDLLDCDVLRAEGQAEG